MAFKEWLEALDKSNKIVKKETAKKSNPVFINRILNALNTAVAEEGYQFNLVDNEILQEGKFFKLRVKDKRIFLTPDDLKKAINSELGEPTGAGESTTKDLPTETVRNFVVKIKSSMYFKRHLDLKLKLDRPNQVFEIEIILKDKEK